MGSGKMRRTVATALLLSFCSGALPLSAIAGESAPRSYYDVVKEMEAIEQNNSTRVKVYDLKVGGALVKTEGEDGFVGCTVTSVDEADPKTKFRSDDLRYLEGKEVSAGQS